MEVENTTDTSYYYGGLAAHAAALRDTFDGFTAPSTWSGSGVALTPATFQSAATALTNIWFGEWVK